MRIGVHDAVGIGGAADGGNEQDCRQQRGDGRKSHLETFYASRQVSFPPGSLRRGGRGTRGTPACGEHPGVRNKAQPPHLP